MINIPIDFNGYNYDLKAVDGSVWRATEKDESINLFSSGENSIELMKVNNNKDFAFMLKEPKYRNILIHGWEIGETHFEAQELIKNEIWNEDNSDAEYIKYLIRKYGNKHYEQYYVRQVCRAAGLEAKLNVTINLTEQMKYDWAEAPYISFGDENLLKGLIAATFTWDEIIMILEALNPAENPEEPIQE